MVEIKEYPINPKRILFSRHNNKYDFSKLKIIYDEDLGFVLKYKCGEGYLTSSELRKIGDILDKYNKCENKKRTKVRKK